MVRAEAPSLAEAISAGSIGLDLRGWERDATWCAALALDNRTPDPMTVTIPAGQEFLPASPGLQTVVSSAAQTLTVPPGGASFTIPTICGSPFGFATPPLEGGGGYRLGACPAPVMPIVDSARRLSDVFAASAHALDMPAGQYTGMVTQYSIWALFGNPGLYTAIPPAASSATACPHCGGQRPLFEVVCGHCGYNALAPLHVRSDRPPKPFLPRDITSLLGPQLAQQGVRPDQVSLFTRSLWSGVNSTLRLLPDPAVTIPDLVGHGLHLEPDRISKPAETAPEAAPAPDAADGIVRGLVGMATAGQPDIPHTVERPPPAGAPPVKPMDPDEPPVSNPTPLLFSDNLYRALQQAMQQKRIQADGYAPPLVSTFAGVETYLVPDPVFVDMPSGDKIGKAFHQVWDSGELGQDFKEALEALLSPESLFFFAVFIGLQFVPGVDLAVDAMAFVMLMIYVGGLSVDLSDALTAVVKAQNQPQFDRAVHQLSSVLGQIGAGALTALVSHIAGKALQKIKARRAKAKAGAAGEGDTWVKAKEPEPPSSAAPADDAFTGDIGKPPGMDPVEWQVRVVSRHVNAVKAWVETYGKDIPPARVRVAETVKVEVTDQAGLNATVHARGGPPEANYPAVRFTDPSGEQRIVTTTDKIHVGAHEVGHTLQNPTLRASWGRGVFEAFNEYFTQELLDAYTGKQQCDYVTDGRTAVVEKIVKILGPKGEELVRAANFGDGLQPLHDLGYALDGATAPGTTRQVIELVNKGQAPQAGALLDSFTGKARPAPGRLPAPPVTPTPPAVKPGPGTSMSPFQGPSSSPAVASAAAELRPLLSEGLEPEQAAWAEQQYSRFILGPWLDLTHPDQAAAGAWSSQVVSGLRDDLALVPARGRWPHIVQNVYTARLWPLDDAAFAQALEAHDTGRRTPDTVHAAQATLGGLNSLSRELNWFAPSVGSRFAGAFGEAALDCHYAIDGGSLTSLRLGASVLADAPANSFGAQVLGLPTIDWTRIQPTLKDWTPALVSPGPGLGWKRSLALVPALFLFGASAADCFFEMPPSGGLVPQTNVGGFVLNGPLMLFPPSKDPVQNPSSDAAGAKISNDPSVSHVKLALAPATVCPAGCGGGSSRADGTVISAGWSTDALAATQLAELECGPHGSVLTVCAQPAPLPPGPFWMGYQELKGPVPLSDQKGWYQYGLVLNDGNPDHGVAAGQAPHNSYRGGVVVEDLQYDATNASTAPSWKLTTYLVQGQGQRTNSNTRVVIAGNKLLWLVPRSDVPFTNPMVRFSAYHAPGNDLGLQPPYNWNASIDPPVNRFAPAGTKTVAIESQAAADRAPGELPWWLPAAILAALGVVAAAAAAWLLFRRPRPALPTDAPAGEGRPHS